MVDLYEEGIIAHIQVHDELNCSIDSNDQKNKIKEIMENTVELKVPLKVDAEIGPSWGEIKKKWKYSCLLLACGDLTVTLGFTQAIKWSYNKSF